MQCITSRHTTNYHIYLPLQENATELIGLVIGVFLINIAKLNRCCEVSLDSDVIRKYHSKVGAKQSSLTFDRTFS